ncbi:Sec-independent protein translocase TatB [Homoserinibacter sp. YIM 151385]|uniref:Sec-independent protein translocase TatB n=1 Tax=Homoserinibacter sp. YIM 151385 TaxID=2985506 RepID=UPI0022F09BC3|nr:Sec-independent protein translocase TatB [Homoserinibacter sp. YIM 151385]WBU38136.1 Sec-independent protein translocase TatB [Homoserinibacter sp. YIM 151385]
MSFGLTFDKLLIIGVIAVFLIGPDRLPQYAAQLARLVRGMRDMASGAKERMREEMGPEFDEVDWRKLDPRQYDPRRIIREALVEDGPAGPPAPGSRPSPAGTAGAAAVAGGAGVAGAAASAAEDGPARRRPYVESAYEQRLRKEGRGRPAPFDAEAT